MDSILRLTEAANLGIHAMVYLVLAGEAGPCSAGTIAKSLQVSESHMAKVLQRLAASDLVRSTRGAGGGFTLVVAPSRTSLLAVLEAIDGPIEPAGCLLGREVCMVRRCWLSALERDARELVERHLGTVMLTDVAGAGSP